MRSLRERLQQQSFAALALLPVRFDSRRFWPLLGFGLLLRVVALSLPWLTLRQFVSLAVAGSLMPFGGAGGRIQFADPTTLLVVEHTVTISVTCTHIEVFALLAPLMWDRRWSFLRNSARLVGAFVIMVGAGVVRIDMAIALRVLGVPWELGHDVLLGVFYALAIGLTLRENAWIHAARAARHRVGH